jgi:succinate-acetate transporter protein
MTAFVSYGFFWVTLVGLILGPRTGWIDRTPEGYMGCFLVMWGIFTLFMFLGTLRANRALQFVFLSLTVLFFLLAIRDFAGSPIVGVIAGWEGILCGASAIYLAMAEVLSEQFGRDVLPIGRPKAAAIASVPASLPAAASGRGTVATSAS